jgi:osmotically-inducible protein OsmY
MTTERSRRSAKGVRAARRPMYSDAILQQDVIDELASEGNLDGSTIGVGVDGSVVRLVGSVPSAVERDLAERAVGRVAGVHEVVDELRIVASARAFSGSRVRFTGRSDRGDTIGSR